MKTATLKNKILSLIIMLTMLVGMTPMSGIVSFATEASDIDEGSLGDEASTDVVSVTIGEETKYYSYLQDAIHSLNADAYVKLLSDVAAEGFCIIESRYQITLDLNGYSISNYVFIFHESVRITDSSDAQTGRINMVPGITTLNMASSTSDGCVLTIDSGNFDITGIHISNNNILVITGGVFEKRVLIDLNRGDFDPESKTFRISGGIFLKGMMTNVTPLIYVVAEGYAMVDENGDAFTPGQYLVSEYTTFDEVECVYDRYASGNEKHYSACLYCPKLSGVSGEHTTSSPATCLGFLCDACEAYYGEAGTNHIDKTHDGFCDGCNEFCAEVAHQISASATVLVESGIVEGGYNCVKFTPEKSGIYRISAIKYTDVNHDPYMYIYCVEDGTKKYEDDSEVSLFFIYRGVFEAGKTYYFMIKDHRSVETMTFEVVSICETHVLSEIQNCAGILCSVCGEYIGEADTSKHVELDYNHWCLYCNEYAPEVECTVTPNTSVSVETYFPDKLETVLKFTPEKTETYKIYSESIGDPAMDVRNVDGDIIASVDDENGFNFILTMEFVAGTTYYLHIKNYYGTLTDTIYLKTVCKTHQPKGEQTCLGYECAVCGDYYGETSDDHSWVAKYNPYGHWMECTVCMVEEEYDYHSYVDSVCSCGSVAYDGVYIFDVLLNDGEYIDNFGNVTTTKPEGGYAYLKDRVLTLSNFVIKVQDVNDVYIGAAIFTQRDLVIQLEGTSVLSATYDDIIDVVYADVIIRGDGTLKIAYIGLDASDGIDVEHGSLTIEGGNILIDASDDGIEVSDSVTIKGGNLVIYADDDGIDTANIYIKGGEVKVYSSDVSFEAYRVEIEDGSVRLFSYTSNGIIADNIIINGGEFNIDVLGYAIGAYEELVITDGYLDLYYNAMALASYGTIEIDESYGIVTIIDESKGLTYYSPEGKYHVIIDNRDSDEKFFISDAYIAYETRYYYAENPITLDVEIVDYNRNVKLELGVDYVLEILGGEITGGGFYLVAVNGIGKYTGSSNIEIYVVECVDMVVGENRIVDPGILSAEAVVYTFTTDRTMTYRFTFFENNPAIYFFNSDGEEITTYIENDEYGNIYFEKDLPKGETYYILYNMVNSGAYGFDVEAKCQGHVGGQATYHDLAVCDLCGEEYGELLVCDTHEGGQATYHEHALCDNCGKEYGELLVCTHMCHKGGFYAVVWDMFKMIYDILGVESHCVCGDEH